MPLEELKEKILEEDKLVSGFNIGINVGQDAGQTIFHCHIHLIPRRKGDVASPRGAVRGVIPEKQGCKWIHQILLIISELSKKELPSTPQSRINVLMCDRYP